MVLDSSAPGRMVSSPPGTATISRLLAQTLTELGLKQSP